jgi:hypothetical protein
MCRVIAAMFAKRDLYVNAIEGWCRVPIDDTNTLSVGWFFTRDH